MPEPIEVRPLTLLAGANSSGKSSLMQPLLLLKQTVEAAYDPGPLLLDGPNVRFTSFEQLLSRQSSGTFVIRIELGAKPPAVMETEFRRIGKRVDIARQLQSDPFSGLDLELEPDLSSPCISAQLPEDFEGMFPRLTSGSGVPELRVDRHRCFLSAQQVLGSSSIPLSWFDEDIGYRLKRMIHLPGLRGNPQRAYPATSSGPTFAGSFENYVASVLVHLQDSKDHALDDLKRGLKRLGLTWTVEARRISDTQVEIQVGRLPQAIRGGAKDLVNVADVGFGVSQSLPVLLALAVAQDDQVVYVEQPEIHLHPKAQHLLASVLADAAKRGAIVIAETHSSLLLRGVQTLVAKGELPPELVKLHWFSRDSKGETKISSRDLDANGAFGDWPVDFDSVELAAETAFLDAVEERLLSG